MSKSNLMVGSTLLVTFFTLLSIISTPAAAITAEQSFPLLTQIVPNNLIPKKLPETQKSDDKFASSYEHSMFTMSHFADGFQVSRALMGVSERQGGQIEISQEEQDFLNNSRVLFENGIGRGGGQGVFLIDGSFEFLDLLSSSKFPEVVPNPDFTEGPESCKDGTTNGINFDPEVHAYTLDKLNELKQIVPEYGGLLTLAMGQIVLKSVFVDFYNVKSFGPWRDSKKISKSAQLPIAFFNGGSLIIIKPLYDKLSKQGRAALMIHEALRQLVLGLLDEETTTHQLNLASIEEIVYELFVGGNKEKIRQLFGMNTLITFKTKFKNVLMWLNARSKQMGNPIDSERELLKAVNELFKIYPSELEYRIALSVILLSKQGDMEFQTDLLKNNLISLGRADRQLMNNPNLKELSLDILNAYTKQIEIFTHTLVGTSINMTVEKAALCESLQKMVLRAPQQ